MSDTAPVVSVVTVVRNDAARLRRTMESVARYKSDRLEYVVVDGASTDATPETIRSFAHLVDRHLSEPDAGIYDAMNKGISLCSGRYLMFLNAGDELLVDIAGIAAGSADDCVVLYGRAKMLNPDGSLSYIKGKPLKSPSRFLKGMPLCHQAILYRRDLMPHYDTSFRIMSDRLLTYQLFTRYGVERTCFLDQVLVNFYEDGFSNAVPRAEWYAEQNRLYRAVGKAHYIPLKKVNAIFKSYVKLPLQGLFKGRRG